MSSLYGSVVPGTQSSVDSEASCGHSRPAVLVEINHQDETLITRGITSESFTALSNASGFFRARLGNNWHNTEQETVLTLNVSQPCLAPVAVLLLDCLQTQTLPGKLTIDPVKATFEDCLSAQKQLMALAQLADYYQATGLLQACLQRLLNHLWAGSASWRTIQFLLQDVPDSMPADMFFGSARDLALMQACEMFADLEVVLTHDRLSSCLMAAPFEVIRSLAASCDTQVAYESTLVTTITLWVQSQPAGSVSLQQKQQLAETICFRGLPRIFLGTVLPHIDWFREAAGQDTCMRALSYLSLLPVSHPSQQPAAPQQPPRGNNNTSSRGVSSRSEAITPQAAADNKALSTGVHQRLRGRDPQAEFWQLVLRAPRRLSEKRQLELTASLSRRRLQAEFHSRKQFRWHVASQDSFAGFVWTLHWRYISAWEQDDVGKRLRQQQQSRQLSGSKRRLENGEQDRTGQAAAADVTAATTPPAAQQPPAATPNSLPPQVPKGAVLSWQLQFAVSFDLPFSFPANGAAPQLAMAAPRVKHRLSREGPMKVTRHQVRQASQDTKHLPALIDAGQKLECLDVLPLLMVSESWDEHCEALLNTWLDEDDRLKVTVVIDNIS